MCLEYSYHLEIQYAPTRITISTSIDLCRLKMQSINAQRGEYL